MWMPLAAPLLAARWRRLAARFLDGELLVAPVLRGPSFSAAPPAGTWYRVATAATSNRRRSSGRRGSTAPPPVGARLGTRRRWCVRARAAAHRRAAGRPAEILVYGSADGAFVLVEDDGETTAYAGGPGVPPRSRGTTALGALVDVQGRLRRRVHAASVTLALAGGVERKSAVVEIRDGRKVLVPPWVNVRAGASSRAGSENACVGLSDITRRF